MGIQISFTGIFCSLLQYFQTYHDSNGQEKLTSAFQQMQGLKNHDIDQ